MLFNSAIFFLFIAAVIPLYGLLRSGGSRKWMLVAASYLFYANWDVRYVGLLLLSTLVDFTAGQEIEASDSKSRRRRWLLTSIITNLGVLCIFKYGSFILGHFEPLLGLWNIELPMLPGNIPVGISFYTFQTLSYTVDVYRGETKSCRSIRDFALFVSFFPQLVAGPIVRSRQFFPQIETMKNLSAARFASGTQRFILGLFKKVVVADNLSLYVDTVYAAPDEFGAITLWCAAFGFALQVYLDFSGYADMAIGLGRIFGIELPENFDAPYLATSVTEFWRRWHMTMSRWLRDYVYIPLGGSRGGELFTYRNLAITMLASGLWHGAAWTFVLWGGVHGIILGIERWRGIGRPDESNRSSGVIPSLLRWAFTFTVVSIALVMFRSEDFSSMTIYLERMFSQFVWLNNGEQLGLLWVAVVFFWLLAQFVERRFQLRTQVWDRLPSPLRGLCLALLLVSVATLFVDEIQFVYFEF